MDDNKQYNRGSEWRKWDLHVHSPASYDYEDNSVENNKIIKKLKENNISVVAITDHHNIDVEKIKGLQILGEGENITVLPGIEFCAESRGSEPIHFIGIFSETSDISYIWNEISSKTNIATQRQEGKKDNEIHCKLEDTCKLIKKIGGVVSVHAGSKTNTLENITNSLPVSMAEKKDIVKNVDIFELGKASDQVGYREKVFQSLKQIMPMIICSDNHKISDYFLKENCWIKADPTFEGLKQIIYEPEDRVFIGAEPPVLDRVRSNKTKYIHAITVSNKKGQKAIKGEWFKDVSLQFNPELVAIIGNKGSGKSAISDILGVSGDTHNAGENHKNLSFLNNNQKHRKFRQKGFAENFEAELVWEDSTPIKISLDKDIDITQTEKVKYLPQNYFESLTNSLEEEGFEKTLKGVIFLHIPKSDRHGKNTFEELEEYKSVSIQKDLPLLESDIEEISTEIVNLEKRKHPNYERIVENLLKEKEKELSEHEKIKPKEIKNPVDNKNSKVTEEKKRQLEEINGLNTKLAKLDVDIINKNLEKSKLVTEKEDLQQIANDLKRFEIQIDDYKKINKIKFNKYGFNIDELIKSKFDNTTVNTKIKERDTELIKIKKLLKTSQEIEIEFRDKATEDTKAKKISLLYQKAQLEKNINILKKELTKPEREYQEYQEKLKEWEKIKNGIKGNKKNPTATPKTVEFYKGEKNFIENKLSDLLSKKRAERIKKSLKIFAKKKEIINLYEEFKKSIDAEIKKDKEFRKKFKMDINVSFKINKTFINNFLDFINKNKKGTFYGKVDGEKYLSKIFDEKDLTKEADIENVLKAIIDYLESDKRIEVKEDDKNREISDQIDQIEAFYNFVFSLGFLEPNYELKLDDKVLEELSPGEKGALLLVFYLMIDKEDTPLIIDQPEDNLDNKSVFEVLTHFIRFAKKRRQIIIVTHNPNLAIGADAEQIIYVNLDKKNNYEFSYQSGAIENPIINRRVVEILEGTRPAFDKRKLKYLKN